jgi:hypothetical protein
VTAHTSMFALQVLNQRIEARIFGDDVKEAGRIGSDGLTQIISESEIKGVLAPGAKSNQLYRGRMEQEFFDQYDVELRLPSAQEQRESHIFVFENRRVDFADIFKVNEDVVGRWCKMHSATNCAATIA